MTRREVSEATIRSAMRECDSHVRRLQRSVTLLADFFPLTVAAMQELDERDEPIPRIDILNRLEQLGVLGSVDRWRFFCNLRNTLAHDYPESIDQTVRTLNTLYAEFDGALELYTVARDYFRRRAESGTG